MDSNYDVENAEGDSLNTLIIMSLLILFCFAALVWINPKLMLVCVIGVFSMLAIGAAARY